MTNSFDGSPLALAVSSRVVVDPSFRPRVMRTVSPARGCAVTARSTPAGLPPARAASRPAGGLLHTPATSPGPSAAARLAAAAAADPPIANSAGTASGAGFVRATKSRVSWRPPGRFSATRTASPSRGAAAKLRVAVAGASAVKAAATAPEAVPCAPRIEKPKFARTEAFASSDRLTVVAPPIGSARAARARPGRDRRPCARR